MTQSQSGRWRVLLVLVVACLPAVANPWLYPTDPQRPAAWAGMISVVAVGLAGRLTRGLFFGLLTAVLVGVHPLFLSSARADTPAMLAQALGLVTFVLTLAAWHQLHAPTFSWWRWLLLLLALAGASGYAWSLDPVAGVAWAGSVLVLLLGGACVVARRAGLQGSGGNIAAGVVTGLLATVGAAALVWGIKQPPVAEWTTLFPVVAPPDWPGLGQFWSQRLTEAFFIPWWATAAILVFAWWRTVRCGWVQRSKGKASTAWVVSWYSLLVAALTPATSPSSLNFATLVPWFVFLVVFMVFDLLHGIGDRLVLHPPEGKPV